MKKITLLILVFICFTTKAQNAQDIIDRLKKDLKFNPEDKKRATIYSDLTWYYSNISLDSAMVYGEKAINASNKLKDSTLIAQVYSDVGAVYFRKGDYKNSKINYLKSYKIRKIRNDLNGITKVNANLANIYNKEGNIKLALKSYLESIDFFEKTNNIEAVSLTKANVGYLFHEMKNYPKAFIYLKEAIAYQEKNNLDSGLCTSYLTLGNVYLKQKDTLNALLYYNKSVEKSKKTGNKISLASAIVNIGNIKSSQKKSQEASTLFNMSKQLRDSLNIKNEESILSLSFVKENIMHSKFQEAKKDLLKLRTIYEKNPSDKENLLQTYLYFIHTYAYLKKPDSVNYYNNKSSQLQNEILESRVVKQTAELETKYQTAKKEKQIIAQKAEAKQKNIYLLGLGVLVLLASLIGFLIYKQQSQKNAQIIQENKLKAAIANIESQNKLQEQRLSISRDLHDNIGSQLTFIISSVDNVKYGFDIKNEKLDNKLTNISSFAKDTIVELRDTIWAMNSEEISFEDLEIRINNFIEKAKLSQEKISYSFAIDERLKTKKLSSVEGMNVYRTIQEAVNNSLKYAVADIISVNIIPFGNQTSITIKDNGKGFDIATIEKGNGLKNMQKRIEEIKGKFDLESNENGTKIEVLLNS